MSAGTAKGRNADRRIVLYVVGGMFALMLLFVVVAPKRAENNPEPTTYNAGTQGTKAAYLLLGDLGYSSQRWNKPAMELRTVNAEHTTLIFTAPYLPAKDLKPVRQAIAAFLARGGRVVATGRSGAELLPDGSTGQPTQLFQGLCYTQPQGVGELAQAGEVTMTDQVRWATSGPEYHVEQRCGADAVVVRYRVGKGEAIWWSTARPLTNLGLSEDASLKLVLASIGPQGRTVLFDEYLHTWRDTVMGTLKGLPWWALLWQAVAAGLLLLLSRSRRSGPLRMPVTVPRNSPVEFAQSMGQLYAKAGATQAATEAARARLLEFLRDQCGLPRELLRAQPPQVAQELSERFGGDWSEVDQHLEQAGQAESAALAPKSALKLVQSLDADMRRLEERMKERVVAGARS